MNFGRIRFQLGRVVREAGLQLERWGRILQKDNFYWDGVNTARRIAPLNLVWPKLGNDCYVAPNASVIGAVELGTLSSVWYGSVIRGDVNYVKIGHRSNVGDNTVIQGDKTKGNFPTIVGDNVSVGSNCVLLGCTVEDNCRIDSGCVLSEGVFIGRSSVVEAGSLVEPGTQIPPEQVWAGNPAQYLRDATIEEQASNLEHAEKVYKQALKHVEAEDEREDKLYGESPVHVGVLDQVLEDPPKQT